MDGNLLPKPEATGGRFNMPPPVCLPMQRLVASSPHSVVPHSPHGVVPQSPHSVVPSPHHIQSPAAQSGYGGGGGDQQYGGGGGGGGVFQFSDSHIGMARSDKDSSGLALSNNPHHSPMPHGPAQQQPVGHAQFSKALPTSTPVQGITSQGVHYRAQHAHQHHHAHPSSSSSGSDAMLSAINYSDSEMLHDSAYDVSATNLSMEESLLSGPPNASGNNDSAFDLFDSESNYPIDNQLSPQPFVDSGTSFNLGQNENSQNSSHGSGSSSVSSASEKTPAKVGRPPRGRGGSQGRERASCPICGKMFNNSSALAKHKLTHSDERKHVCSICAKAFKRQDHLNGHMMTHRSKKPFECKFEGCEKSYCDARSLRRHLENHHSQQLNDPSCMAASQFFEFDHKVILQTGIYRQSSGDTSKSPGYTNQFSPISPAPGQWTGPYNPLDEPKPVQCQLCPRRFKNIPALNGHMRLHGGYFKKDSGQPSTGDDAKVSTTASTTTTVKVEPPSSSAAGSPSSSSQDDVKPKMTSSASLPIIIAPRGGGGGGAGGGHDNDAFTSSALPSLTSAAAIVQSSRGGIPAGAATDMLASSHMAASGHMALSHHIELMSLNAAAPPYPNPHSSIASMNSSISASQQQGMAPHLSGGEFGAMPRQQYEDMAHAQDMRTNQFPSPAQLGMSQLARRRSNVPAPLDPLSLNMGGDHLNSPGPASCSGSHPATPSHPMTPSHPHTPAGHAIPPGPHPVTPGHAQTASHPHTPAAHTPAGHAPHAAHAQHTPSLPYTPSLAQTPGAHPLTPRTPHTPTHPCTPGHASQSAQHFQFPPPQQEPIPEQYSDQQFVQQQQNSFVQQQLQQQQQMQLQRQQEQLDLQQVQQQLEQELAQLQQEQTIQQIKEDLQSHERQQNLQRQIQAEIEQLQLAQSRQHTLQQDSPLHSSRPTNLQSQSQLLSSRQGSLQQQEEFMDTNMQMNAKTFVVQRCQVDKVSVDLEEVFRDRPLDKLEEFKRERKRRASADPDKFTQPTLKRPLCASLAEILAKGGGGGGESMAEEVKRMAERGEEGGARVTRDLNGNTKTVLADCCEDGVDGVVTSHAPPPRQRHRSSEHVKFNLDTKVHNTQSKEGGAACGAARARQEQAEGVFKNPSQTAGLVGKKGKRKHRPEPLIIPPQVSHFGFPSRLRSPRLRDPTLAGQRTGSTPPPYTPPPMLSPARSGSGLFWTVHPKYRAFTPKSAPIFPRLPAARRNSSSDTTTTTATNESTASESTSDEPDEEIEVDVEPPPETDVQPHVNVGPAYQAMLPDFIGDRGAARQVRGPEERLWDPSVLADITEEEIQCYQDFACCAAIPGNGTNKEYALHLLYLCRGDIKKAILRLMQSSQHVYKNEPIDEYKYQESDVWSAEEIEAYHQALFKHNKDFYNISQEMGSKSVKQCIEFYYIWKKVCPDEYRRLRTVRRKRRRDHDDLYGLRSRTQGGGGASSAADASAGEGGAPSASPKPATGGGLVTAGATTAGVTASSPHKEREEVREKTYVCQYNWCHATFATRQALNGHSRVHSVRHQERMRERENSPKPPSSRDATPSRDTPSPARPPSNASAGGCGEADDFPCRVCGKVFYKVKSRNAHMKTHRQTDADKSSPKPPPPGSDSAKS